MIGLCLRSFPSWCHFHFGKCGWTGTCFTLIEVPSCISWKVVYTSMMHWSFSFFSMSYFAGMLRNGNAQSPLPSENLCSAVSLIINSCIFPPTVVPTDLMLAPYNTLLADTPTTDGWAWILVLHTLLALWPGRQIATPDCSVITVSLLVWGEICYFCNNVQGDGL